MPPPRIVAGEDDEEEEEETSSEEEQEQEQEQEQEEERGQEEEPAEVASAGAGGSDATASPAATVTSGGSAAQAAEAAEAAEEAAAAAAREAEANLILGALRESQDAEQARLDKMRAEHQSRRAVEDSASSTTSSSSSSSTSSPAPASSSSSASGSYGLGLEDVGRGLSGLLSRVKQAVAVPAAGEGGAAGPLPPGMTAAEAEDAAVARRLALHNAELRDEVSGHMVAFYQRSNRAMAALESGTASSLNHAQDTADSLDEASASLTAVGAGLEQIHQFTATFMAGPATAPATT